MTVAPSPAQTPGAPVASGSILKRVPPVVWLGGAGAAIGLVIALLRKKEEPVEDEAYTYPDEQSLGAPASPVAYVTTAAPASEPAETVGAVGQSALDSMARVFESLMPLIIASIENRPNYPVPGATPPPGGPSEPGMQPPPEPRPTPSPGPKPLPAGYKRGDTITETSPAKRFPGAIGWIRIASGGKGAAHWIDYHVAYATKLQRWRYVPNTKPKVWRKLWEGPR